MTKTNWTREEIEKAAGKFLLDYRAGPYTTEKLIWMLADLIETVRDESQEGRITK